MSRSIMEPKGCRKCYVCGWEGHTEEHHIFYGTANRKKAEHFGLKVHLCPEHHRGNTGVHGGNKNLALWLKQEAQRAFEKTHTREEFREQFGRNYLDEPEEGEEGKERDPEGQQESGREGFKRLAEEDERPPFERSR